MWIDFEFRVVVLVLMGIGLWASSTLRGRADREGGAIGRWVDPRPIAIALRLAGGAFYLSLLAWLLFPPLVEWAAIALDPSWRWVGAALLAPGLGFQIWALRHLGRNVTPTAITRPDGELVTSGPYRWVRHPLYSGMLLTLPGLGLLSANAFILLAGVATFTVILLRSVHEEAELRARFGDRYVEYCRRTHRILPGIF